MNFNVKYGLGVNNSLIACLGDVMQEGMLTYLHLIDPRTIIDATLSRVEYFILSYNIIVLV